MEVNDAHCWLIRLDAILAGLVHDVGSSSDTRINSIASANSSRRPHRSVPSPLPHDRDQWALHLLPGGRAEGRAGTSAAARISVLIADVRASLRPAIGSLPPYRARLSGLWTQQLAGPRKVRIYVRSL